MSQSTIQSQLSSRKHAQKRRSKMSLSEILACPDAIAHFWKQVEKSDGCWVWRGNRFESGYG
ncbi:MAG: hypothetical protein ACREJC_19205, partial [Tepidisphaeraceae bacterium]